MTDTPGIGSHVDFGFLIPNGQPKKNPLLDKLEKVTLTFAGGAEATRLSVANTTELVFDVPEWGIKNNDGYDVVPPIKDAPQCGKTRPLANPEEVALFDDLVEAIGDYAGFEASLMGLKEIVHPAGKYAIQVYAGFLKRELITEAVRVDLTDAWWPIMYKEDQDFMGTVTKTAGLGTASEVAYKTRWMWFMYHFEGDPTGPHLDVDFYVKAEVSGQPEGFIRFQNLPIQTAKQLRKLLWHPSNLAQLSGDGAKIQFTPGDPPKVKVLLPLLK